MARRLPYDLVLMDIQMPEMDGFEATREIRREQSGGHRVPIVALTANVLETDRTDSIAAGMDGFVSKPVRREDLLRVLEQWTKRAGGAASGGAAEAA